MTAVVVTTPMSLRTTTLVARRGTLCSSYSIFFVRVSTFGCLENRGKLHRRITFGIPIFKEFAIQSSRLKRNNKCLKIHAIAIDQRRRLLRVQLNKWVWLKVKIMSDIAKMVVFIRLPLLRFTFLID